MRTTSAQVSHKITLLDRTQFNSLIGTCGVVVVMGVVSAVSMDVPLNVREITRITRSLSRFSPDLLALFRARTAFSVVAVTLNNLCLSSNKCFLYPPKFKSQSSYQSCKFSEDSKYMDSKFRRKRIELL